MSLIAVLAITAALSWAYLSQGIKKLQPLFRSTTLTELSYPNTHLAGSLVGLITFVLVVRSAWRRICGYEPRYQLKNGVFSYEKAISLKMPFEMSQHDIDLYEKCLDLPSFAKADVIGNPLHLQLLLSALTEPAMLHLLAKTNCPIDPIGSVNVRNYFEILAKGGLAEQTLMQRDLQLMARMDQIVIPVKRGWEFAIIVELRNEERVALYRQTFTILQFSRHRRETLPFIKAPTLKDDSQPKDGAALADIDFTGSCSAHWAQLSRDHNPIHVSSLAAKLFGFKGKIAHGNHVVARSVARLQEKDVGAKSNHSWMQVEFKRPCFVPCRLEIRQLSKSQGEKSEFEISTKGKTNISVKYGA